MNDPRINTQYMTPSKWHLISVFFFALISIGLIIFSLVMAIMQEDNVERWLMIAIFVFTTWIPSPGHKLLQKSYKSLGNREFGSDNNINSSSNDSI